MKKLLLASMALFMSFVFVACSSVSDEVIVSEESGVIELIGSDSHDWGDINIVGGDVSYVFSFQNSGEGDLIINTASTSCMCTSAEITLANGDQSPVFGMHGNAIWDAVVASGDEFEVNVVFDPMAHGLSATGPISRSVMLSTSDGDFELNVQGDVLSEEDFNNL